MDNPWATPQDDPGWPAQPEIPAPADDWGTPWPEAAPPADSWERPRPRAVPPELLQHCHKVSQEIWPPSDPTDDRDWRSGFEHLPDILALLAPADSDLQPSLQFSQTATANAMNEALKLTRHLPACANSPLSRLLASKGSLEWEKSIRAKQDAIPETAHVGWRVLDKDGRVNSVDETKPRKVTGGLLSFWNRRASATQIAPAETPSERSARSSLESTKPSSRAASPSRASVPPPPPSDPGPALVPVATAPSAVSRFLNRFSRAKQNGALALSSDDLEFLSDIVPSANDPPDEDNFLEILTGPTNSSSVPQRIPPPISPPPLARPFSAIVGPGTPDGASVIGSVPATFQIQNTTRATNVPVLAPPPSAQSLASVSRTETPPLQPKDIAVPSIISLMQRSSRPNSRPQSSFMQRTPPLLSIPPLLPPPPVSPPQTPRPGAMSSNIYSSTTRNTDTLLHDPLDSDEEFSAFTSSFPPPAPFPTSDSRRSPSPPSPPPRRMYERTHYPSSSSASSVLSPASQTSADQLCSAGGSSIPASLDGFDDFVSSSPVVVRGRKDTPSPPPLPLKSRQTPLHTNMPPHHAHTWSQSLSSPTVNTSLISNRFSTSTVSDAEHQRTQSLVNQAAARGGFLWPNSPPNLKMVALPPPPSSSTSPKSLIGGDFSLLDDVDTVNGGDMDVGVGMDSTVSSTGMSSRSQLQPSSPPLPSTSLLVSFSSLGSPSTSTTAGSPQPAKPRQTGGLSAQDLSFFEGW